MKDSNAYIHKRSSPCHCLNIRRAARAVTRFYDKVVEPSGLKIAQYALLRHLEVVEPVTISTLAKIIRIDRTTLSRNIKPLMDSGLIAINSGSDSRSRQVTLTEAGRAAMLDAGVLWDEAQASINEYLGEELDGFERILLKLETLAR